MLILLMAAAMAASCSPKVYPEKSGETRIEIRERVVTVQDSVRFDVPQISERISTRDTSSHLENEWARSDASVMDGILSHSLETVPHTVYVPYRIHVVDTIYIERTAETVTLTEYVEKSLKWYQKTLIIMGAALLAVLTIKLIIHLIK